MNKIERAALPPGSDQAKFEQLTRALQERAPAMAMGRAMGAQPSIEEAFFLSGLLAQETEKMGLPEHWYLQFALKRHDEQEAKTLPYKCGSCGKRHSTSDKRNACCPSVAR